MERDSKAKLKSFVIARHTSHELLLCVFEIGEIYNFVDVMYVHEGEIYWENNLKTLSTEKKRGLRAKPPKAFAAHTLQTV